VVIAPSKSPRVISDRIKNDRHDAVTLARLLRAGELAGVWISDEGHEAMRDLVRARHAAAGQTSIVSTQTSASAPRANDAPSPEVRDKWVNLEYPQKLGIIEKLTAEGYQPKWESANNEAISIDIGGWEFVALDQRDGTLVCLNSPW